MICQQCEKNIASVHVTEVEEIEQDSGLESSVMEQHLCEQCAQTMELPHAQVQVKKTMADIWKLLQQTQQTKTPTLSCPGCQMSLEELQRHGRVGCSQCYAIFREYLGELFERMHGAREHIGRLPGVGEGELERMQRAGDLKRQLEQAIREEAYETAANLRDELKSLEVEPEAGG
jgi:protein arginine kinase activator